MNLLCAAGLPGAQTLDIDRCLATRDGWAARVKSETDRHLYKMAVAKGHDRELYQALLFPSFFDDEAVEHWEDSIGPLLEQAGDDRFHRTLASLPADAQHFVSYCLLVYRWSVDVGSYAGFLASLPPQDPGYRKTRACIVREYPKLAGWDGPGR